jgi:2-methylfumaryl-CoA isomerase
MAEAELLGMDRPSIGNHIYGAFGRDFGTSDSQRVMVAGISASQWTALCTACELEASIAEMDDAKRFAARKTIAAQVEAWCMKRDFAEVERVFNLNKVCWGRYRTVSDLIAHDPRVSLTNPVFERVDTPGIGEHLTAGATVSIVGVKREPVPPAPWLGQHTEEVLAQVLGLGSGEIGLLFDTGIVAGPERDPYHSHVD